MQLDIVHMLAPGSQSSHAPVDDLIPWAGHRMSLQLHHCRCGWGLPVWSRECVGDGVRGWCRGQRGPEWYTVWSSGGGLRGPYPCHARGACGATSLSSIASLQHHQWVDVGVLRPLSLCRGMLFRPEIRQCLRVDWAELRLQGTLHQQVSQLLRAGSVAAKLSLSRPR